MPTTSHPTQAPGQEDNYLDKAWQSFCRVWYNRFLWWWGIFLPSSFFFSLNYIQPAPDRDKMSIQSSQDWEQFLRQNGMNTAADNLQNGLEAVLIVVFVGFFLWWLMSAIVRAGVIRALDQLQEKKASRKFNFLYVWRYGQAGKGSILWLDVVIFSGLFLILLVLVVPVVAVSLKASVLGTGILAMMALFIFAPLLFLGLFLRQVGAVYISLSSLSALAAIEIGYSHLLKNLSAAARLLLVLILLSFLEILVLAVVLVVLAIGLVAVVGLFSLAFPQIAKEHQFVVAAGAFLIFVSGYLWVRSIFSLWVHDLWLWWVKKTGGLKIPEPEKADRKILVEKTEPAMGR